MLASGLILRSLLSSAIRMRRNASFRQKLESAALFGVLATSTFLQTGLIVIGHTKALQLDSNKWVQTLFNLDVTSVWQLTHLLGLGNIAIAFLFMRRRSKSEWRLITSQKFG